MVKSPYDKLDDDDHFGPIGEPCEKCGQIVEDDDADSFRCDLCFDSVAHFSCAVQTQKDLKKYEEENRAILSSGWYFEYGYHTKSLRAASRTYDTYGCPNCIEKIIDDPRHPLYPEYKPLTENKSYSMKSIAESVYDKLDDTEEFEEEYENDWGYNDEEYDYNEYGPVQIGPYRLAIIIYTQNNLDDEIHVYINYVESMVGAGNRIRTNIPEQTQKELAQLLANHNPHLKEMLKHSGFGATENDNLKTKLYHMIHALVINQLPIAESIYDKLDDTDEFEDKYYEDEDYYEEIYDDDDDDDDNYYTESISPYDKLDDTDEFDDNGYRETNLLIGEEDFALLYSQWYSGSNDPLYHIVSRVISSRREHTEWPKIFAITGSEEEQILEISYDIVRNNTSSEQDKATADKYITQIEYGIHY